MIKCEIRRINGTVTRNIYSDFAELKADLREADLRGANLGGADLWGANLGGADLRGADLWEANLGGADLWGADLREADLDFSCLSFSCRSLFCKTSEKQRIQLMFHALSWINVAIRNDNATDEEKIIFNQCINYANKFHREDVKRLK